MTIGEDRVRVKFNPSADTLVDKIKQQTAALIDLCSEQLHGPVDVGREKQRAEEMRLWALAMTHYEDAAMWAVKAATISK
jgi:hypothetical protein